MRARSQLPTRLSSEGTTATSEPRQANAEQDGECNVAPGLGLTPERAARREALRHGGRWRAHLRRYGTGVIFGAGLVGSATRWRARARRFRGRRIALVGTRAVALADAGLA